MIAVSADPANRLNALRLLLVRTSAVARRYPLTDTEQERLDDLLGVADRHLAAERGEDASSALGEALSMLQVDTAASGASPAVTAPLA